MKVTLNAPQPPTTSTPKTSAPPTRARKSGTTRALCRQTRAAVEGWLEKLLAPESDTPKLLEHIAPRNSEGASVKKSRRKELLRRASTGSLFGKASDSRDDGTRRTRSLFSRRGGGKENAVGCKNNNNNNEADFESSASAMTWLTPIPNCLSALETTAKADEVAQTAIPTTSSRCMEEPVAPEADCSNYCELCPEMEVFSYVMPPVEMPNRYRQQDRRGGMIVAGRAVLFTNSAFKRKLRNLNQLRVIPEHTPAHVYESRFDFDTCLYGLQHYASPPGSFASSATEIETDIEPLSHCI